MRKLMIVAVVLSVLAWSGTLAMANNAATLVNSEQIAGDSGPNGG